MSPPDPLRHLLQKLMEAQLNRSNSTPPAPPPYSTNPPPRTAMPELMSDIVYTNEPNPLAITIDATINVVGNNNFLALTSSQPASSMTISTTTAASSSSKDSPPAQATTGQTSSTDNEPSTPPSRKHDREAKAAKLASIILKALHQADGLTDDHGRKRTVSVILKCGIKVEGSNNEVFSDEDVNGLTSCSMHVSSGGRKRASSV